MGYELNQCSDEEIFKELKKRDENKDKSKTEEKEGVDGWPMICADCGKHSTVPFKPNEDRPVRCYDCYKRRKR